MNKFFLSTLTICIVAASLISEEINNIENVGYSKNENSFEDIPQEPIDSITINQEENDTFNSAELEQEIITDTSDTGQIHIKEADSITLNKNTDLINSDSVKAEVVDSVKSWRKKSFNIGIGWEIGKENLLIKWNSYNSAILDYYVQKFKDDTLSISSKIAEDPPDYNVIFPMRLSFSLPKKNGFRLTPTLTYMAVKRDYASRINEIHQDSVNGALVNSLVEIWKCERRQSLRELSLGLRISKFISDKYFIINGVEDVTFNVGFSLSPLVSLIGKTKIKGTNVSDSTFNFKAFGLGANWEIGLSTYKTTPGENGLEVGISYHGGWRGQFIKDGYIDGKSITNVDVGGSFTGDNNSIDYMTHKLLIYVDLILTKKEKRNKGSLSKEENIPVKDEQNDGQEK